MAKMRSALRTMVAVFAFSVPPNYLWEVAQMPLYVVDGTPLQFAAHCIVPSLGDGVWVVTIFAIGWAVFQRLNWFFRPGFNAFCLMLMTGFIISVLIEWLAVYQINRWSYTASMPILPWVNVGLSPVLQMMLLPPLIFKAASWWMSRSR